MPKVVYGEYVDAAAAYVEQNSFDELRIFRAQ